MTKQPVTTATMIDQIERAIAKADGAEFEDDPGRFRRLALAALKPMTRPTEAMVDAAYEAVRFDEHWAVNSRRDFRKGVRAMILAAMDGG
jgi:hypothetical protein